MKKVFDIIYEDHFRVAVFGSARIKKNDEVYKTVYNLGKELGKKEFNIVTGGGPGLMEAAHKGHLMGAKKNEAHSIGLKIKLPFEQNSGFHIDVVKEFNYFSERLDHFIALSNAVVVAPGGIGTLLEFAYTWQLIQVGHIYNIPIILEGKTWRDLVKWLKKNFLTNKYASEKDFYPIFLAKDNEEVMKIIAEEYEMYKKGERKIDLNIIREKIKKENLKDFTRIK